MGKSFRFPLSDSFLQRYRVQQQRRAASVPPGERLIRRRGHSLEFREYQPYSPGDDIRFIDWNASLRRGAPWEFWSKTFDAQDALQLVVSVDTSATLRGPEVCPKSEVAGWLAEAVVRIAILGGDRVVLHRMEAEVDPSVPNTWRGGAVQIVGSGGGARARAVLKDWERSEPRGNSLREVQRHLRPSACWVIISDYFFAPAFGTPLANLAREARRNYCRVLAVEVDSWPWERSRLHEASSYRINGPGVPGDLDPPPHYDVDQELLQRVEHDITSNKSDFFDRSGLAESRTCMRWPADRKFDAKVLFRDWFASDDLIAEVFRRSQWV